MRKMRWGLVGCGVMGKAVGRHLRRWSDRARWVALCDISRPAAERMQESLRGDIPIVSLEETVRRSDWVVEAASPGAVEPLLRHCIRHKKNLMVMSSGGLLHCPALLRRVRNSGIRLIVPSGAIAGLDALRAARLGSVQEASITTRKRPKALEGAPGLPRGLNLAGLRREMVVFEGNAGDAIAGFPANINVAATLGLVSGLGPKRTRVKIVADPKARHTTHQVVVRGSTGRITTTVQNMPSPENPRTSALAVLASCAAIDDVFGEIRIGT